MGVLGGGGVTATPATAVLDQTSAWGASMGSRYEEMSFTDKVEALNQLIAQWQERASYLTA